MAIAKIKSFLDNSLKSVTTPLDRTTTLEPEIGIRIVHSPYDKTLRATVLGARHLPQNFGFTRVNSYVVKIKFFPGKEKFETTSKNESWPQWNEEFTFHLRKETKIKFGKSKVTEEFLDGSKLIIATLYAILEDKPLIATDKKDAEKENSKEGSKDSKKDGKKKEGATTSGSQESKSNKLLGQLFSKSSDKEKEKEPVVEKKSIDKRRTVGATTISLDVKNFVTKPPKAKHSDDVSTGDIWKPLRPIASGISGAEDRESLKGQLYIKMSVVDGGRVTHFWKSDRFNPCVSMKFAQDQAQVIAENPYEGALKDVSFVVKFVSKNKIGKKTIIGHFVIGPDVGGTYSEQWKQAMAKPGNVVTKWQVFE
ncbi:hypothetical protein G9C98_003859 [Cotesia typhae]|uniref:C2 domain-containing protein n=1 Tax=Cotesia typhae TaxID=2053667 RepID=A0A8J5QUZ4_9HYME|nr:hypothetical protein G9C98_003859 [Cotesia typhae]